MVMRIKKIAAIIFVVRFEVLDVSMCIS